MIFPAFPMLAFLQAEPAVEVPPDPIVVTAVRSQRRVIPPHTAVSSEELLRRQPSDLGRALKGLAGISAKTNSRGETIARVRGAEERQTQVFLDGAPLAVPWDGRADIGALPATIFSDIEIVKGAAPIEYGANAIAGVVDLRTRSGEDARVTAVARAGSLRSAEFSGVAPVVLPGGLFFVGAASLLTRDAYPVAGASGPARNTDLESATLFGAVKYERAAITSRAILFHNKARRGIAAESSKDPDLVSPRYWRYPHIELTQLILSSEYKQPQTSFRFVGWRQWFLQKINQYRNSDYEETAARQEDRDDTLGTRLTYSTRLSPLALRISGSAQTSRHGQVDTRHPFDAPPMEIRYRQNLYSLGIEADVPLGAASGTFGIGYDRAHAPLTGDKPRQTPMVAVAFSGALRADVDEEMRVTLSGGRRSRFPTPRELFGEALGRFLINPDLRPETVYLADVGMELSRPGLNLSVNPFASRIENTISQRVVEANGRSLRQRFNLSGSWSFGIDFELTAKLSPSFSLRMFGTALRARADQGGHGPTRLLQRPFVEAGLMLEYEGPEFSAAAEIRHSGSAIDLSRNGEIVSLSGGMQIDLGATRRLVTWDQGGLFLTFAADNITDASVMPQLGLAHPGRSLRIGLEFR